MRVRLPVALSLPIILLGQAEARDPVYTIGRGGWELERFGAEATILRSRPMASRMKEAGLLLSCTGADHRLRLVLPGLLSMGEESATAGLILLRAAGAVSIARVTIQGATLMLTDRHIADVVLVQLRASTAAPRRLDVLLHAGSKPVVLERLTAFHVSLSSGFDDGPAFRDASVACGIDLSKEARKESQQ